jgi:3-deoxy-manno-octulosonate cytidylyltransferase (CMP-KDO synthetase)
MKILGVIPARYGSTRFPGKPLVVIDGKTMIRRVYEQATKCDLLAKVVVATDNETIFSHVRLFDGNACMTGSHHASGTERCQEVVEALQSAGETYDCVINIQGDEPFIDPRQIAQVAHCFNAPEVHLATLVKTIGCAEELMNPNVVKAVTGRDGFAILFSRAAIPFVRGKPTEEWLSAATFYKHIGIYGYLTPTLREIVSLTPTNLEQAESLEQLRWLEHGYRIKTEVTESENIAIDTPEDLLKITNNSSLHHQ